VRNTGETTAISIHVYGTDVTRIGGSAPVTTTEKEHLQCSLVRVQFFSVSLDGFGTGAGQTAELHFGHAGERLHEWMFTNRSWSPGGRGGIDDAFLRLHDVGVGAEIMGAGKWGPSRLGERPGLEGRLGSEPAVPHAGVRADPSHPAVDRDGGRHHLPLPRRPTRRGPHGGPRGGRRLDVRIGGAPPHPRVPRRRLVDHLHVVVVPIVLGRGVRLWDGLEGLEKDYQVEAVSSPSGVTHVTFTRS
jgi:hypothetical protein